MSHRYSDLLIILLIVIFVSIALFTTRLCDDNYKNSYNTSNRFSCNDSQYQFETVVDNETNVTYLIWRYGTYCGGITVLIDQNGKPILN